MSRYWSFICINRGHYATLPGWVPRWVANLYAKIWWRRHQHCTTRQDGWHAHEDTDGPVHVWPRGDNVPHDIDGLNCVCGPDVEWRDPVTGDGYEAPFVRHHSLDGRELEERP